MRIPIVSILTAIVLVFILFAVSLATYTLQETEQAIITRFGKPIGGAINEAGLHFKVPFVDTVNVLEKRALEWDGDPNQLPTRDKLFIHVDTYARWRISDPLLFFQRLRTVRDAQTRLDDILDGQTRDVIANHDLLEIVRSVNRESVKDETLKKVDVDIGVLHPISFGRARIGQDIFKNASTQLKDLGVELLDIRFKRINYNEDVQLKIYERMISERNQIASKFRSEGEGEAARILGEKERDLRQIESEAYRKIQEIQGKADAQATDIYAQAYNQSPQAYDFFQFTKTMDTFRATLGKDTTVLLGTQGDFFKFLQSPGESPAAMTVAPPAAAAPAAESAPQQ